MKKANPNSYRLLILMLLLPVLGSAQSKRVNTESFDVENNPEILMNISHAEISVKTWNKDKVEVKTTFTSESLTQEELDDIFESSGFMVLGNRNRVEIKTRPNLARRIQTRFMSELPMPPAPPSPDMSGLDVPAPPKPPQIHFDIDFDYLAFKEEGKVYLEKFKKQLDSVDFKDEMIEFKKAMKEWKKDFKEKSKEFRDEFKEDSVFIYAKRLKPKMDSLAMRMKQHAKNMRSSNSVKKTIEIKVPKSAMFKLNLRHSKISAESMSNLSANLNYSDFTIETISGEESKIQMNYSSLNVGTVEDLKLQLEYSKQIQIGNIDRLNANSKMSQLTIDNLKDQALIQGSYGELTIRNVDPKFSLIDIKLEKSTANLNLPEAMMFDFYAKSSNSKFNINSDLDFKISKSFDDVIYTNESTQSNSKRISLSADYSSVNLN